MMKTCRLLIICEGLKNFGLSVAEKSLSTQICNKTSNLPKGCPCIPRLSPHLMQPAFSTIVPVGSLILPLARRDAASGLVLCNSISILFHNLASGRVCRDAILFALLGCAVRLTETARTTAPATSTVVV
jgi:hypothetical protein